ncbi:MAG: hypothetical protein NTX52_12010 [Planctomycetota bacterium]|nr:hypothetical protein [Planctomycetota bacterium]
MQISIKKILIVLVIIIILSQLHKIAAVSKDVFRVFYDSFQPLRDSPPLAKYTAALAVLLFVYVTIYFYLKDRRR